MREIDVDSFAGGGGASLGIQLATGRPVDVAINHDWEAIWMHMLNHPETRHYQSDIWSVDPQKVVREHGPIRIAWFSPDCTYFSKARGRAPIREEGKRSRDLAWVVIHWAQVARPRMIFLENVEEFTGWCPLGPDGLPCPDREGETFALWIKAFRKAGYVLEWRLLRAKDYGVPTSRRRLFLIARRDGLPIVWPEPTHGPGLLPYRTASECIDWTIPCHSIFLTREEARMVGCRRPLAESTMRRIAKGVYKYVIHHPRPFIVPVTHQGADRVHSVDEPFRTVTSANRGELSLVRPELAPIPGDRADCTAAFLAQHNTGMTGHDAREPFSTIVQKGCTQALVTSHLTRQYSRSVGQECDKPVPTITTRDKTALVTAFLSRQFSSNVNGGQGDLLQPMTSILAGGQHHALVKAFLMKYYGTAVGCSFHDPAPTVTTRDRLGIVTVENSDYLINDIGMRMFMPRELYLAQGFPADYVIAPIIHGKPLSKTAQIRMCGNSVPPGMARAIVHANVNARSAATTGWVGQAGGFV